MEKGHKDVPFTLDPLVWLRYNHSSYASLSATTDEAAATALASQKVRESRAVVPPSGPILVHWEEHTALSKMMAHVLLEPFSFLG